MAFHDDDTLARIAPVVRRVLVVDPTPAPARATGEMLKGFGCRNVWSEGDSERALHVCEDMAPTLIVMESAGPRLIGADLAVRIRRSRLECRMAPIIMVSADATTSNILRARDSGVHEFLAKPFSTGDLLRRIVNVATRPRDWVEGVAYVGPDRRRFNSGEYKGPRKRETEQDEAVEARAAPKPKPAPPPVELDTAGRGILETVMRLGDDPAALDMLMNQAEAIKAAALTTRKTRLAVAAAELHASCALHGSDPAALAGPVQTLVAAIDAATAPRAA